MSHMIQASHDPLLEAAEQCACTDKLFTHGAYTCRRVTRP